jgi:mannose-6-phosphate isomerase-like protein (cupin superfamily)
MQGLTLNLLRDDSVPPDHLDHWQAETVSTGEGSPFSVPQHWHKKHAERMTVIEGRVKATLNGVTTILSTGESIYIEPYVVHGFEGFAGERAVVRERADPAGDYKAAYESLNLKSSYRMS